MKKCVCYTRIKSFKVNKTYNYKRSDRGYIFVPYQVTGKVLTISDSCVDLKKEVRNKYQMTKDFGESYKELDGKIQEAPQGFDVYDGDNKIIQISEDEFKCYFKTLREIRKEKIDRLK